MDLTLIGKIKTILRPFKNPNIDNSLLVVKRLGETTEYLAKIKLNYSNDYSLVKSIVTHHTQGNMPAWLNNIMTYLSDNLDVFIFWTRYLHPGYVEPVSAIVIVGEGVQVDLAKCYLTYIVSSVEVFTDIKNKTLVKAAERNRRMIRRGTKGGRDTGNEDARRLTSNFRNSMIKDIQDKLLKMLEIIKMTHKDAFYKGHQRTWNTEKRLISKYDRTWRKTLSSIT